ncbi:hypothetical protein ACIOD1_33115 [Streptomyces sp. NPDC088097]|uniref:hypothetical protein n=1 Tax=Streptomyces sp. NPDC088097 TaxID=3365823 RepID=UPI00382E9D50
MTDEQITPEVTDLGTVPESGITQSAVIPATEVAAQDVGVLSVRYVDGTPVLVVSGGTALPAELTAVNGSGAAVASYTGTPIARPARSARTTPTYLLEKDPENKAKLIITRA